MRKVIFATVVVLLALSGLGLAGDIDGVWWIPEQQLNAVWVLRENAGTVLAFFLAPTSWPNDSYDIMIGQMRGNVCPMVTTEWSLGDLSVTVTFDSPGTATVYVESCKPRSADVYCAYQPGTSFTLEKVF